MAPNVTENGIQYHKHELPKTPFPDTLPSGYGLSTLFISTSRSYNIFKDTCIRAQGDGAATTSVETGPPTLCFFVVNLRCSSKVRSELATTRWNDHLRLHGEM